MTLSRPSLAAALLFAASVNAASAQKLCASPASTGDTLATTVIQQALDRCAGKGIVRLGGAPGFISGPLRLPSHTTLEIATGTTLFGSPSHDDYPAMEIFREPGRQPLLLAQNAEDITIRGGGIIDGHGEQWWEHRSQPDLRPRLIIFDHSRHITMENITVQNSPMWQIVPYYSSDLTFRNMKILAPTPQGHNTDGIDPFSSSHIVIDHVLIDTGDDNVAIKSGQPKSPGPDSPSDDIRITDCTFLHGHGLSVGSEVAGGVHNLHVERVTFNGTTQGIRIKSGRDRGNDIGNLTYRDITMQNVGIAIQITEYYGSPKGVSGANATAEAVTRLTPHFHDISIEDVHVLSARQAMVIDGLPEAPIQSVTLKNVDITADKGAIIQQANVTASGLVIHPKTGDPIAQGPGAKLSQN